MSNPAEDLAAIALLEDAIKTIKTGLSARASGNEAAAAVVRGTRP